MKITLAAVGKLKPSPEKELFDLYLRRLSWDVTTREIDIKKPSLPAEQRRALEAEQILETLSSSGAIIALDERGKSLSSEQFAQRIGNWQNEGISHLGFCIGGQDGLDESVRKRAQLVLSFGALTWPHMLARAMLAEQLYRASTLLSGHPYHRS